MEIIYWLIAVAVLVVTDILTMGFICIWFAMGALAAAIAAFLGANLIVQIVIFAVASIVLLIFTRPIAMKHFNNNRNKTNKDSIIGRDVKVITDIDNVNEIGSVKINGVEWTARSEDGQVIKAGEMVNVIRIEGVKAIVKKK